MKITLAYLPQEEGDARAVERCVKLLQPDVKVRKSERNPPFKHVFLTTKKPPKTSGSAENACNMP